MIVSNFAQFQPFLRLFASRDAPRGVFKLFPSAWKQPSARK